MSAVPYPYPQCTDEGLKALSEGVCRHVLSSLSISDGTWDQGYPTLLSERGIRAVIAGCPHLTHVNSDVTTRR